jgi:hypothetical protein
MAKAKKKSPPKKDAAKEKPLKLDMSFEEAIRLTVTTKVPKKKKE